MAQTKSPYSRLEYCYSGENVEFKFNFKNINIDSVSFVIYCDSIRVPLTFKKNNKEIIVLHGIGPKIKIKYSERGKEQSRNVNLLNHQCDGKARSKKKYDE